MHFSQRHRKLGSDFEHKTSQGNGAATLKDRWLSNKVFQLAALGVAIAAAITITVPLGVCLSGDGRCGRSSSSSADNINSKPLPLKNDAATLQPVAYPQPTVKPVTANANPLLFQGFEWYFPKDGKHWSRLSSVLPELYQMGVGAVWIPPPTKAATNASVGYDVYDLWDLGEFNTHNRIATSMGSKADLLNLAETAHKWGVGIIVDAVLNQRSGADYMESCAVTRLNPDNRMQPINPTKVTQVWVGFNYTARGNNYSNKTWSCDDFTGVDYDAGAQSNGVFKIDGVNNDFATDVSTENGNFDYLSLIDVAYDNPSVRADVKLWGPWVTGQLGASGFRLDAAKHISRAFIKEWIVNVKSTFANAFAVPFVAEYWTSSVSDLLDYVGDVDEGLRVFDVPLLTQFAAIANGDAALTTMFDNTIVSSQPDNAVTLVGNHDTQLGQSSDNLYVQDWFRPSAYAFTLLRQEGVPCLFYGDIFGVCDATGSCSKANASEAIANLAAARTFFGYGDQQDYNATDGTYIGWVRKGDSNHSDGLAVVISTGNSGKAITMDVGESHAGETWVDVVGKAKTTISIGSDGAGSFSAPDRGVSVFVNQESWSRLSLPDWNFDIYN
jgi:alpha-amylase